MRPQLLVQTLMLKQMLMLGMDTMDTDLMDIGDTMERDPLMKKLQLLDQTLMLRLILIMDMDMDITDHTDTTGDTMERDLLMLMRLSDLKAGDTNALLFVGAGGAPPTPPTQAP